MSLDAEWAFFHLKSPKLQAGMFSGWIYTYISLILQGGGQTILVAKKVPAVETQL